MTLKSAPVVVSKLFALLIVTMALHAAVAQAGVTGYAEPAYTKTSTQNSYWWHWTGVDGFNANTNQTVYNYYLCLGTIHNGVTDQNAGNPNSGPNHCALKRSSSSPSSGDAGYYYNAASSIGTLANANTYQMCATGYYFDAFLYVIDNASSGTCPASTIDRDAPSISASVDGDATYTKNPVLAFQINYSDPTSPPWFGNNGIASNWDCINRGGPCTPGGNPDPNCSARHYANSRTDYFTCTGDATSSPDGDYYFCAFSADAAVPDNPNGTNQFVGTSNQANLSGTACGHVTLDRVAPAVSAHASSVNVTTGTLVNFSTSATDATSGLSNSYDWDFGDNTPHGAGLTPSHTYTQPGTYLAKVTTADGAGNPGQGTVTITVNPPTTSPGGTGGGTGGTGGSGGGGSTQTPGTTQGTTGATPSSHVTSSVVSQQAGGGGAVTTSIGSLDVIAPKKFRSGKKTLVMALTPDGPGAVKVALLKGAKVVARRGAKLGGAGTYELKLKVPKKLKRGNYKLQITFTPQGSHHGKTKKLRLKVLPTKKKSKRHHKIAARRSVAALSGIHTPAGKPTGVAPHASRRFAVR